MRDSHLDVYGSAGTRASVKRGMNNEDKCPVCLNTFCTADSKDEPESNERKGVSEMKQCNHKICKECYDQLPRTGEGNKKCPVCRENVTSIDTFFAPAGDLPSKRRRNRFKIDVARGALTKYTPDTSGGMAMTIREDVRIPEGVRSIDEAVFFNKQLNSVTLPTSLTHIGARAFANSSLTSVNFGAASHLIDIGDDAFAENNLTSVTLPKTLTHIGKRAFTKNELSGDLDLPDSLTNIGDHAFSLNKLRAVYLYYNGEDSNLKHIGDSAFFLNHIDDLELPASLTSIGNFAFSDNRLPEVILPHSLTNIGDHAFSFNKLTNVTLPNALTHIGDRAFSYNNLSGVNLPDSLTHIGDYAFHRNKLTSVTLPNALTHIGDSAFSYNDLSGVPNFPESLTHIGDSAFAPPREERAFADNTSDIGEGEFDENQLNS